MKLSPRNLKILTAASVSLAAVFAGAAAGNAFHNQRLKTLDYASQADIAGANAIMVMAGDSRRETEALAIQQPGQKIMISGPSEVWSKFSAERQQARNISIVTNALDTRGNALECANWLDQNKNITNVVIVSSAFHLPRVGVEMKKALPANVNVKYYAVEHPASSTRIAAEGLKTFFRERNVWPEWGNLAEPYDAAPAPVLAQKSPQP